MNNLWAVLLLAGATTTFGLPTTDKVQETDGESSRKVLGSSVVTSVSVILDQGNKTQAYFADAVGKPVSKPATASQLASPINLLNPDRYEFFTFNDNGDLVKKVMSLKEIQSIIANTGGDLTHLNSPPEKKVDDIVSNVQNVLKEEMAAHKPNVKPVLDTPDVSSTWSMILPSIFGNQQQQTEVEEEEEVVPVPVIEMKKETTTTKPELITFFSVTDGRTSTSTTTERLTTTMNINPDSSSVAVIPNASAQGQDVEEEPNTITIKPITSSSKKPPVYITRSPTTTTLKPSTEYVKISSSSSMPTSSTFSSTFASSSSSSYYPSSTTEVFQKSSVSDLAESASTSTQRVSSKKPILDVESSTEVLKTSASENFRPITSTVNYRPIIYLLTTPENPTHLFNTLHTIQPESTTTKATTTKITTHPDGTTKITTKIIPSTSTLKTTEKISTTEKLPTSTTTTTTTTTLEPLSTIINADSEAESASLESSSTEYIQTESSEEAAASDNAEDGEEESYEQTTPEGSYEGNVITTETLDEKLSVTELLDQLLQSTDIYQINSQLADTERFQTTTNFVLSDTSSPDLTESPIGKENTESSELDVTTLKENLVYEQTTVNDEPTMFTVQVGANREASTPAPLAPEINNKESESGAANAVSLVEEMIKNSSSSVQVEPAVLNEKEAEKVHLAMMNSANKPMRDTQSQSATVASGLISGQSEESTALPISEVLSTLISQIVSGEPTLQDLATTTAKIDDPITELTTKIAANHSNYRTEVPHDVHVIIYRTTANLPSHKPQTSTPKISVSSTNYKLVENQNEYESTTSTDKPSSYVTTTTSTVATTQKYNASSTQKQDANKITTAKLVESTTAKQESTTTPKQENTTRKQTKESSTTPKQENTTHKQNKESSSTTLKQYSTTPKQASSTTVKYSSTPIQETVTLKYSSTTPKQESTTLPKQEKTTIKEDIQNTTTPKQESVTLKQESTTIKEENTTPKQTSTSIKNKLENTTIKQVPSTTQVYTTNKQESSTSASTSTIKQSNTTPKPNNSSVKQSGTTLKQESTTIKDVTKQEIKSTTVSAKRETPTSKRPEITTKIQVEKRNSSSSSSIKPIASSPTPFTTSKVKIDDKTTQDNSSSSWTLVSIVPSNSSVSLKPTTEDEDSSSEQKPNIPTINIEPAKPVDLVTQPLQGFGLADSTSHLDTDIYKFVELCNELAFGFWQSVTNGISSARSVFTSPFAATSLLAMVFLGARGSTSGEMNEILKLDDMVTFNPHLIFRNVTESIEVSPSSGVAISAMVRELYSDKSKGKLLNFYKERARQFYDGHVEEVSFKEIGDIIRRRTNLLVKRQTWGKIQEYVKDVQITARPPLAGISASIFQTDCSGASTDGRDGELYFVVLPTIRQRRLIPVPAVVYRSGFLAGYDPGLDATSVALGNKDQVVSTIFIIPGQQGIAAPGDGLARLEKHLLDTAFKYDTWKRLLQSLIPRPGLEVQIPRFSHRSIINATIALQKMGLKDLFDSKKADLRGLNGVAHELHLSDLLQINTFATCGEDPIEDTHHSEIYPATAARRGRDFSDELIEDYQRAFHDPMHDPRSFGIPLSLRPRQARLPEVPRLRFDRPFLYFVRHNPTGLILHMGRFNPRLLP